MAGININDMVEQFLNQELDPSKIGMAKIYNDYSVISSTIDLTTMAHIRNANSAIATLFGILGSKESMCYFWEKRLSKELVKLRLEVKYRILAERTIDPMTATARVLATIDELVDQDIAVINWAEKLSTAAASRSFWQSLAEKLSDLSKRIDSSGASLGLEAKINGLNRD